jgi:hypothetical protein
MKNVDVYLLDDAHQCGRECLPGRRDAENLAVVEASTQAKSSVILAKKPLLCNTST